ncbi:MAG: efflux transporter, family, subunit [bacterium]|nr:efflux transporter, family, subunit [bacterium]
MSIEKRTKWVYVIGVVGIIATLAGVVLIATSRRAAADREGKERTDELAKGPRVRVAKAQLSPSVRKVELQGEARPYASVTLYAKVSGYLKDMRVDKGDKVKANQIVAVVQSPETDRQYEAAMADASYKRANARRASELAKPGVVSAAEAETQVGVAAVAEAQVATLAQQKSYEVLRAPFAGTVTARYADPGALVQAATGAQTGALPVVTISTPERLRVYVYVPQHDASFVKVGDPAVVTTPERADVQIQAVVARRADELDPRTRMMLVEVDLDNREGRVVAGSFVTVTLTVATPPEVMVPVEALVLRGPKASVFILDGDTVHLRPVTVSDNDGSIVRLARGLRAGEPVALNLGENVGDGARVQPMTPPPSGGRDAAGK